MVKMSIVWILAIFFSLNSILLTFRTNFSTGHILMWGVSLALVAYGIFHTQIDAFCAEGVGRVLKYCVLGGVAVFAGLFIFVAVSGYSHNAKGDEKAIIVLGAGLRGETVSDLLRRRLEAALAAYEENPNAVLVVTGGQGPGENIPEALAMQRWLVAHGVPEDNILVEDKSTSTEENLQFSIDLLAQRGITTDQPVAIVTNAFHCYRAGSYAEKLGYSAAHTVPASMSPIVFFPSYMREVLAILYMWVFRRSLA